MPRWVKTTERLPSENGSYFVRGKMGRGSISFKDGQWNKDNPHLQVFEEILEWLDEESNEPVFSLEDMRKCWLDGVFNGVCDYQENKSYKDAVTFKDYMKEEYNIDITKQ